MNVLVVEDEKAIREVESAYLERRGYVVYEAIDGIEAIEKFHQLKPDIVVLDLNLPKQDGITVCKEIRKGSNVPIIMVTARIEEINELLGLEVGADDYIKKPFSPNVLVARVDTLLRRIGNGKISFGDIIIDPETMIVHIKDRKIELTTTQFNILYTLAKRPGKAFTRSEILDHAYDDFLPKDVLDRTVDAHIKAIRKKLEPDKKKGSHYILTVVGRGYKFNDEI